jgi:hypothetical protein
MAGADTGTPERADAMAFIRVIGDVRVDFIRVWRQPIVRKDVEVATGSGFVIAPSGLVLTSRHVVVLEPVVRRIENQEAKVSVEVTRIETAIGAGEAPRAFEGWVAASDPELDLAALQVSASALPYLPFGDSDVVELGRPVSVLGFPFGRLVEVGKRGGRDVVPEVTVTSGSLSAAREDEEGRTRYLQTDASMSPGSSGGPMIDEDGYAVGVVRMRVRGGAGSGPGFGVPINLVKDFLDSHGLLAQLPVSRLRPAVAHALDWKGLRVDLPEGFSDTSPARLRLEASDAEDTISFRIDRVATPWAAGAVEEALLGGDGLRGFVPAPATLKRQFDRGRPPRMVGTATGTTREGRPFRVEYALLDLRSEKVVARYLGPPDALAFNLGTLRGSLERLEADRLMKAEVRRPLEPGFEPVEFPGVGTGRVFMPVGWSLEPATSAACPAVPEAPSGLAASPVGDFTLVFRALRWTAGRVAPERVVEACGPEGGRGAYAQRSERLGLVLGAWGAFVARGEEMLLLEAEAPESKLPFVRDAFKAWIRRVAEGL